MKLYLSVISAAMVTIAAVNLLFQTAAWYYIVIAAIFCTALQFALDGIIAIAINKMPDRWFGAGHPLFRVTEAEKRLYQKLKVRRWKDKVWELGGLDGFSKKNLTQPTGPQVIEKFIIECNKGVVTHRLSYPIGFLATLVLRYNTPKLQALLTRLKRKSAA